MAINFFTVFPHLSPYLSYSFPILGLVFLTWQKKPYDQQVLEQIFIAWHNYWCVEVCSFSGRRSTPFTHQLISLWDSLTPAIKAQLRRAGLTQPERVCLNPSPGVYDRSNDFDITLIFKLFRTICGLAPPPRGWDVLPNGSDHSLVADLVRIKYYRNEIYGHHRIWKYLTSILLVSGRKLVRLC